MIGEVGHLVTQFQGQILRAAANNRVRGHASVCGYAPPSPKYFFYQISKKITSVSCNVKLQDIVCKLGTSCNIYSPPIRPNL